VSGVLMGRPRGGCRDRGLSVPSTRLGGSFEGSRQERQRFDRSHTRHRGLETRERTFAQAEAACARVLGAVCGSDRLVLWHCEGAGWSGDPTIRRA